MKQNKNKELATVPDLKVIRQELSTLRGAAEVLTITGPEELVVATSVLSQLNQALDKVTTEKERVTKPLNEALKAERSRWKPLENHLETSIASIRAKMTIYATEAAKLQKAEEEAIARRIGAGKGHLSLESASRRMELVEKVEKVEVSEGSVSFRPKQVLNIFQRISIPREYWVVDEDLVFADLKAGKVVEGAVLDTIMVPFNSRN